MNELLFFGHVFLVVAFSFMALRLGPLALTALIALQAVLANLFVVKQMTLFGLNATCSDVFAIGSLLALNLLQEFFGREAAQKAVRASFLSMAFFASMAYIHLSYGPSAQDQMQGAFLQILSATPRIVFASVAVYWVVQQIDVRVFGWLRERCEGRHLPFRLMAALFLSQTIDTVLFSFLGLYGLVSSLLEIMLISLLIKGAAIACSAPLTAFARRFARAP